MSAPAWQDGDAFVAAKLVLTCEDRLLVMLRDDFDHIPFPAHWDLPGGGREGEETALGCALRELEEEFGLVLPPERLTARQAYPSVAAPGRLAIFFSGFLTAQDITAIRFGDEGTAWQMMPVAEYITHPKAVPAFRSRVVECLTGGTG